MDIPKHIGSRIRAARTSAGISQSELARRIGVDQPTVSRLEKGERRDVPASLIARIAAELGTSIEHLVPATAIADKSGNYGAAAKAVLSDYDAPAGLRELVGNSELVSSLKITDDEINVLAAIPVKGVSRDGYVQLLFTLRAVTPTGIVTGS